MQQNEEIIEQYRPSEIEENGQSQIDTPTDSDTSADPIAVDLFNSAGNTNLEEEDNGEAPVIDENDITDKPTPKGKVVLGKVISGKATVKVINIFLPSLIVFMLSRFGYKADKRTLRLSLDEEQILIPVVQDCLDYTEINFGNPWYALAFVATMIYGSKIMDTIPDLKKAKDIIVQDTAQEIEEVNENVTPELEEVRRQLDIHTARNERNRILIAALSQYNPIDKIEAWKVYNGIYPERTERAFTEWYEKNYEKLPDNLKFAREDTGATTDTNNFTL